MNGLKVLIISLSLFLSSYGLAKNWEKTKTPFHSSHTGEQTLDQHQSLSQKQIKQVQKRLNQQGHSLVVDGIFGPNTKKAVKNFQKRHQLVASGELTAPTLENLGIFATPDSQTRRPASLQQDPNTLDVEEDNERFKEELRQEDSENKELDYEELDVDLPINSTPIDNY